MAADQQFCLRWNNHQSTLVAVFDTLLENGTLVDCTVAAEGQFMKAHKVVLSACSPYFQLLLSQHYEKHPIIILKDVKFQELKAMMDYMYRGEVNISQDQLGALLKAAESLQIKGLSDSGAGSDKEAPEKKHEPRKQPSIPPPRSTPPVTSHSSLSIENRRVPVNHSTPINHHPSSADLPADSPPVTPKPMSRDECASPIARKRKKHRRRSSSDDPSDSALHDGLEASSSNELPPQKQSASLSNLPSTISSVPLSSSKLSITATPTIEEKVEPEIRPPLKVSRVDVTPSHSAPPPIPIETVVHKIEPTSEEMIEPKTEFVEENNEDSIEDLTLDDDDELDMDDAQAGPSHGGDESSQGYAPWHMAADQSRDDEVFMAAQEAVGAHRDSQGSFPFHFDSSILFPSITLETDPLEFDNGLSITGKISHVRTVRSRMPALYPKTFSCPSCDRSYSYKRNLVAHMKYQCGRAPELQCPFCPHKTKLKYSLKKHVYLKHGKNI